MGFLDLPSLWQPVALCRSGDPISTDAGPLANYLNSYVFSQTTVSLPLPGAGQAPRYNIETVSWADVATFCRVAYVGVRDGG